MNLLVVKARTAIALGLPNLMRAVSYRLRLKLGTHPVQGLAAAVPQGPYFGACTLQAPMEVAPAERWVTEGLLFSRWRLPVGSTPPDWSANPMTGKRFESAMRPWWRIPDFDPRVGDIKVVWELSRFDWLLAMAQHVREQRPGALERLEVWLGDWCRANPPYLGPNWKCGQEASIRVMHLAAASLLLGQESRPTKGLTDLIAVHLQRIAPTMQYAVAQDNNHGTSEAAALYIGGHWLAHAGDPRGASWAEAGRHWLQERAQRLIGSDGSFSQYSVNYHRLMLDTFSLVECWRLRLQLPRLSDAWHAKAVLATRWLWRIVDLDTGDAPNIGANDGARLLPLCSSSYRDYRPSVQLAAALFEGVRAVAPHGVWDEPLRWLGLDLPSSAGASGSPRQSDPGNDGGFGVLVDDEALLVLRYPRFRFRPNQSDALHTDFWLRGQNLLRDGGTFSYNEGANWLAYFSGVQSHNTVQFDGRDQMPRLGRFLFGQWLATSVLEPPAADASGHTLGAGYADAWGAAHTRRVSLSSQSGLVIVDEVKGFKHSAVLRWRLSPGHWDLSTDGTGCKLRRAGADPVEITVSLACPCTRAELLKGWESRHYLEKEAIPVLEVEVATATSMRTEIIWGV